MKPYQRLSEFYSRDWGDFCLGYLKIISYLENSYSFVPKTILDISCGTGELVRELHRKGYCVLGSDISENMIDVAKSLSSEEINYRVGDMAKVKLNTKFDLIISAFDSINYLTDSDHLRNAFKNVYYHLNHSGYFVFDVNTPLMYKENYHGVFDQDYNGKIVTRIFSYDLTSKMSKSIFDFGDEGLEEHIQKAYNKGEVMKLLKNNGFEVCKVVSDFDLEEADDRSHRLIFIAKRG